MKSRKRTIRMRAAALAAAVILAFSSPAGAYARMSAGSAAILTEMSGTADGAGAAETTETELLRRRQPERRQQKRKQKLQRRRRLRCRANRR